VKRVTPSPNPVRSSRRSRLRSLAVLGLFTGAAFVGGATWGGRSSLATTRDASPYAVVGQLARILVQVENDYVDPVDRSKLLKGAIKGMVEGLDPHSSYMSAEDFEAFQNETEGQFGGLGIEVDMRGDQLTIIAPIEGSPAAQAGIRSGDRILSVDGDDIERIPLDKMIQRMRGPTGTHVKLFVRRTGVKDPLVFDLVRAVVHVPSVSSRWLEGGVAYVRVKQFQERTHEEFVKAAARLRARGTLTGVILDLRSDPGGLVDQAAEIADEFLDHGTIYTTRHRGEVVDEVTARPGGAFSALPVVVLVDEWSASASELVAGALQDSKRALVVGANTFGKGSVQTIMQLPGGDGLRLTTARYYTPNGRSLQAEGVHPDVIIEPAEKDKALLQLHERDLEGHLEADPRGVGSPKVPTEPAKTAPVFRASGDAGPPEAVDPDSVEGSEAATVPVDPAKGHDFALRVAYQIVRGVPVDHGAAK
jgi:carboxyl-terminal processing protease